MSFVSPSYLARINAALATLTPASATPGLFAPDGTTLTVANGVAHVNAQALSAYSAATALSDTSILAGSSDGTAGEKIPLPLIAPYLASKNPKNALSLATDATGTIIQGAGGSGVPARNPGLFTGNASIANGNLVAGQAVLLPNGTEYFSMPPAGAGAASVGYRYIPLPAAPCTIDMMLDITMPKANFWVGGMVLSNYAGGNFSMFGLRYGQDFTVDNRAGIQALLYGTYTTFMTLVGNRLPVAEAGPVMFLRASLDGTNIAIGYSLTGLFYYPVYTGSNSTLGNPAYIGYGMDANCATGGIPGQIGILDYIVTTSVLAMSTPCARPLVF